MACHVPRGLRLASLTTVRVPQGVDPRDVTRRLLEDHDIEIANGLGQLAGKVWRIGLMGHNARRVNVLRLLDALNRTLPG
jgi:alanine-glyoxylate transaminase/serine-glyoxylate transaminase/serine-pyruvate transaminase